MTDYSQLYLIWPPIAILLIGLLSGWFLQRHVLVKQMEDLETQHLDLLRAAEDEMHAAREEARLQGQKLDEAQMAITLGYERLTLLDRRLKEAEDRIVHVPAPAAPAPVALKSGAQEELAAQEAELVRLRQRLAEQEVFAERLGELERELQVAKAEAARPVPVAVPAVADAGREQLARSLRERAATIESLRHEVAGIEALRLRLSELVSELGAAQAQVAQITKERNALASIPRTVPSESTNELVRKLADAIARRQELELALAETHRRMVAAEAERDQLLLATRRSDGRAQAVAASAPIPKAMAAAAGGGGLGFQVSAWQAEYPAPQALDMPLEAPRRAAYGLPPLDPPPVVEEEPEPPPTFAMPLLSPAQLAGGLSQLLFENRIQFAPDRADILPDSKLLLEDIADLIVSSVPVRLVVEGHTERGDARSMFYLSERRAVAVMERLAKLGVPETRMMSVGYGDTRAIDENATYEGRMRNRRIEIRVIGRI